MTYNREEFAIPTKHVPAGCKQGHVEIQSFQYAAKISGFQFAWESFFKKK